MFFERFVTEAAADYPIQPPQRKQWGQFEGEWTVSRQSSALHRGKYRLLTFIRRLARRRDGGQPQVTRGEEAWQRRRSNGAWARPSRDPKLVAVSRQGILHEDLAAQNQPI
jgi:hypothetical protein